MNPADRLAAPFGPQRVCPPVLSLKCVRSTPYGSEPTRKQEQKEIELVNISLWSPRWNPKRTEQRTNYYMS